MPEVLRRFAREKLRVPPDQIYVLSDAVYGKEARPPVKPIIEQTVERFLATCRRQDRIVLVFVGHAVEIDDEPYLVPLEGELTAKETLIPLKWLYDRLATCPARQKVLVMDVCREDTARGNETARQRADGAEARRRAGQTAGRSAGTDGVRRRPVVARIRLRHRRQPRHSRRGVSEPADPGPAVRLGPAEAGRTVADLRCSRTGSRSR